MMIKELKLRNFRGVKRIERVEDDQKIDGINFTPLTILLGPNNSGKTTILESLFLLPNPLREVPYSISSVQENALSVIHEIHKTVESEGYAFLFLDYLQNEAVISCNDYEIRFLRKENDVHVEAKSKEKNYGKIGEIWFSSQGMRPINKSIFIENSLLITPNLIKFAFLYLKNNWASIMNLRIGKKVAKDASLLSIENYLDITMEPFLGGKISINAYLEDGKRIRLGDLGEGIQNYIIAKMLYILSNPKVLLWDDVEAHFNPKIIIDVAEWFSDLIERGKQIIISTHSLEAARLIASLNEENTIIYLTKLEDNVLKAKKLMLQDVENLLKAGIDIRLAESIII